MTDLMSTVVATLGAVSAGTSIASGVVGLLDVKRAIAINVANRTKHFLLFEDGKLYEGNLAVPPASIASENKEVILARRKGGRGSSRGTAVWRIGDTQTRLVVQWDSKCSIKHKYNKLGIGYHQGIVEDLDSITAQGGWQMKAFDGEKLAPVVIKSDATKTIAFGTMGNIHECEVKIDLFPMPDVPVQRTTGDAGTNVTSLAQEMQSLHEKGEAEEEEDEEEEDDEEFVSQAMYSHEEEVGENEEERKMILSPGECAYTPYTDDIISQIMCIHSEKEDDEEEKEEMSYIYSLWTKAILKWGIPQNVKQAINGEEEERSDCIPQRMLLDKEEEEEEEMSYAYSLWKDAILKWGVPLSVKQKINEEEEKKEEK